jgi:uroporphyrinogen decarboxylase
MIINAGADCISICDDLGSKQNLLMSPGQYRKYIKPWHKKLCELAHNSGVTVHLHSHGAISKILDDLADCSFDFVNPFDPEEGFDIENILRNYSNNFTLCGGLPASFWELKEDKQTEIIEKNGRLARKYGHFIFMDSGGIPENTSRQDFERVLGLSRKVRNVSGSNGYV